MFKRTNEEEARVWVACVALPWTLLIWWLFENHKLKLEKSFLFTSVFVAIILTSWRLGSDYQFYQYQKQFSKKVSKYQGFVDWSEVPKKKMNLNNIIHPFYLTPYSLFLQNQRDISSTVTDNKKHYLEIHNCFNDDSNSKSCNLWHHCFYEKISHNPMCRYFNLDFIDQSRFFNLKPLIQFISKRESYCEN